MRELESKNFPPVLLHHIGRTCPLLGLCRFPSALETPGAHLGEANQSGHSAGTLEPWPSPLPAGICSPIALCLGVRLHSGDSCRQPFNTGPSVTSCGVKFQTPGGTPARSHPFGSYKEPELEPGSLGAGTWRVKPSQPPACPLQGRPQLLGIPGVP